MKKLTANIRGFLFYLSICIGLFTFVPPWFFYCLIFKKHNELTLVCKPFFGIIFSMFGIRVKIEGTLPEQGKACFMLCNHQSFIDVPVILYKIFPCVFLAKKSLFKIPYFGQLLAYADIIPVERGNPQLNADLPKQIKRRLSRNLPVAAFPEGTRSENGELLPFKNGIFRIIKDANIPVFPITIIDAYKVLPKSGIALYPGEIKVIPHKIISAEEIAGMSHEELKERVWGEIKGNADSGVWGLGYGV
jgi:1-acyl-sn-glycerol-3-phosphate acyltransferase